MMVESKFGAARGPRDHAATTGAAYGHDGTGNPSIGEEKQHCPSNGTRVNDA